jgi:MarR family
MWRTGRCLQPRPVLLAIAGDPGIRLRDIATTLGITEHSACAIVTDLTEAGCAAKQREGRRNRYQIQARLRCPGRPASNPPSASCSTSSPASARPQNTADRRPPAREVAGLGTGRVITAHARTCSAEVTRAAGTKWR